MAMRTKSLILVLFMTPLFTYAQQETLFGDVSRWGAFGSPIVEISSVAEETIGDVGGGGALIMNDFFFGGYGLGTENPNVELDGVNYDVHFKHGGLWFGYTPFQDRVIHPYISTRMGWGKTRLRNGGETRFSEDMFLITPEAGFELNLATWFKVAFSGGYRIVTGIDELNGLNDTDFRSPMGTITFRFGGWDSEEWDEWD